MNLDLKKLGDQAPISQYILYKIRHNYTNLRDNMVFEKLSACLIAKKVISSYHYEMLNSMSTNSKKNMKLLDILKRRCMSQYKNFIECLRETGHRHVASLLEAEGGNALNFNYFMK